MLPDAFEYPNNHAFIIFTTSEIAPEAVTKALDGLQSRLVGVTIHDLLTTVDHEVSDALMNPKPQLLEPPNTDEDDEDDWSADDIIDSDLSDWEAGAAAAADFFPVPRPAPDLQKRIREDLRAVRNAGFRIGHLGDVKSSIIITISCRISRLGLSVEAMQAWSVRPEEYLVLLIRHPRAYQSLQEILSSGSAASSATQIRLGLCDSYKPCWKAAVGAFAAESSAPKEDFGPQRTGKDISLRPLFIGEPLTKLLNERLWGIIRLRESYHFSWTTAECVFHTSQGKVSADIDASLQEESVPDTWRTPPPPLLVPDHMADTGFSTSRMSLPLLVMQFTLRHFVKCTEFCLVCHCKTSDGFEALKPYVCSNGLCLYQYIALGMGPSLEYEIRTQPWVVDMLVSLAYSRARSGRLADFPSGLALRVPDVKDSEVSDVPESVQYSTAKPKKGSKPSKRHEALFDAREMRLSNEAMVPTGAGNWVMIMDAETTSTKASGSPWHCRVKYVGETSKHLYLHLPVCGGEQLSSEQAIHRCQNPKKVRYVAYDKNFDELSNQSKQTTIIALLNALPSIEEMSQYLGPHSSDKPLSSWRERLSPASLDLLRWIVASNRSCILQEGNDPQHLVTGMDGFIQFRLVQGAPDKEHRFLQAVQAHAMAAKPQYPTIFAWHGSPLYNWHSILREGLHFETTAHGRAYGDGVYMSNDFCTSSGYCGGRLEFGTGDWPNSKLNMASIVSLNEVVNCTKDFVCAQPHYVVKQLDWIQPRYLFVGTLQPASAERKTASTFYTQDPAHRVRGPSSIAIEIPHSASSICRRQLLSQSLEAKGKSQQAKQTEDDLNDHLSVSTSMEDLTILLSDDDSEMVDEEDPNDAAKQVTAGEAPQTDYVPGTLQVNTLPLLQAPKYATSQATKLLQQHLQATLKVQKREKLHELGWYVDPNLITTVYQWIVELHSFDPDLPLAKDLKSHNLKSVVLEIRFPSQFPMDPPFVRVVRPRFLEFANGGGGHVTAGGAMCMELLTNSGWSPVASIESVLLQVRMAITNTDPRPGRLAKGAYGDYSVGEAIHAYKRACIAHGWKVPNNMEGISW